MSQCDTERNQSRSCVRAGLTGRCLCVRVLSPWQRGRRGHRHFNGSAFGGFRFLRILVCYLEVFCKEEGFPLKIRSRGHIDFKRCD